VVCHIFHAGASPCWTGQQKIRIGRSSECQDLDFILEDHKHRTDKDVAKLRM